MSNVVLSFFCPVTKGMIQWDTGVHEIKLCRLIPFHEPRCTQTFGVHSSIK
jgi:hypothetical protein